ncbi:MAG: hypothetical protein MJE66_15595 [Proteobacteria bacterium]|nr:hypothetical protein [Pseudomonadota bacterium]
MRARAVLVASAAVATVGCAGFQARHEVVGDSRAQIWLAEESQVRVRNAQSRVFDTTDKRQMLEAIVATLQDVGFQIEVLDETLGIVSGKKFLDAERPSGGQLPTYLMYDEESLVVFNRSYRTWGPFLRRSDLVRMTVTVRSRNEKQLIVRASAQYYLRPVEDAAAYQQFYAALEQALFTERSARTP